VYALAYSSDSAFVLSGGWDGQLLLLESGAGNQVSSLRVGQKAVSACAFGPDNRTLLAGSIDGSLSIWDATSHHLQTNLVAHIRPISSIRYAPDGKLLVTASWDKQVALRNVGTEAEATVLYGHNDIVSGAAFAPDGKHLLTWSHDCSAILWDVDARCPAWRPEPHRDRIQAGAISPDGQWAATASRDGQIHLCNLPMRTQAGALTVQGDVRGCWFLLDAVSLAVLTVDGRLSVLDVPELQARGELRTGLRVECGEIAPSGAQVALGCADGQVRLVHFDGLEQTSLFVTATQSSHQKATLLDRLLGKTRAVKLYEFICPTCRHGVKSRELPRQSFPCPQCRRPLRINSQVRQLQSR
jgi:WD40 repeat protein